MAAGGLEDMMGEEIQTATEETQLAVDTANVVAADAMANSTLPNAPGADEPDIDSAVLETALAALKAPDESKAVTEEVEAQTPEAKKEPSRYEKRVQQLVSERNQARDQMQALQNQFVAQQAETNRQQAAFQRQMVDMENRRLEMEAARQRTLEDNALSPEAREIDRAKKKFLSEAQSEAQRAINPELQALRAEVQQERQWREGLMQEAKRRATFADIDRQGKEVLNKDLLAKYDPEDREALKEDMEEMLHAFAGAYKQYPSEVAPKFQQFLGKWFRAEAKALSKSHGSKVAQTRAVPQALPASKAGVESSIPMPRLDQLKRNNFDNHVQWMAAGRPALRTQ